MNRVHPFRLTRRLLVSASLPLLLASAGAHAYRPSARALLAKAADKQLLRETKSMRVDAETQLYDVSGVPQGAPVSERFLVLGPATVRKETANAQGAPRVELRVEQKVTVRDGSGTSTLRADPFWSSMTASAPLEAERAAERMLKDAKALGINTDVVSFGRFDGRVCFIIGSKPWDVDKPQLWLDKDTLLVVRVVRFSKRSDGTLSRVDERYLGWGSPVGGNWFPASLETWIDERLERRTLVRNVERNLSFDAGLFK